jgi:hypothetical protein
VTVHFIRIGKTGSTALFSSLRPVTREMGSVHGKVRPHPHKFRLEDVPVGHKTFFTLRDPVSRFMSAFASRWRQGQPRYDRPWNKRERVAFERFQRPQQLAEALVGDDADDRAAARFALRSITHVNRQYTYWLRNPRYLQRRLDDIVFILRQEHLDDEFPHLVRVLGLPETTALTSDPVAAHRSPEDAELRHLDDRALAALRGWLAPSYELLDRCEEIRRERGWSAAAGGAEEGSRQR